VGVFGRGEREREKEREREREMFYLTRVYLGKVTV
jgi:hypothetical protein